MHPTVADGFDALWVWDDPRLARALDWYRDVALDRRPAKFRIAATVAADTALDAPDDDLWAAFDRAMPAFLARWRAIREEGAALGPPAASPTLLDLVAALGRRMLARCVFCEWRCRVDRTRGAKFGTCKLAAGSRVSTAFHHPGEELVYRGTHGSGTIFFTSCNMRCAFCQNGDISTDKDNGAEIDPEALAAMAWVLRREGCHNVNWVGGDPTIHLHAILDAVARLGTPGWRPSEPGLAAARAVKADPYLPPAGGAARGNFEGGFNAPMLWNSNFIMTPEAMALLRPVIDVWLPDFKFGPGDCAKRIARTPWYWDRVTRNLALIRDWGEDFTIRHLVMPNHVACCTEPVLAWIAEHMPEAPVNVMDQYHPDTFCDPASPRYEPKYAELARRASGAEIRAAWDRAAALDLAFDTITHEKRRAGLWL